MFLGIRVENTFRGWGFIFYLDVIDPLLWEILTKVIIFAWQVNVFVGFLKDHFCCTHFLPASDDADAAF